jgi:death-on-curing protein
MEPRWLTIELGLAMHAEAVALYGGAAGVRDRPLLESALAKPRNLHAYGDAPSLFDLAAALCAGIVTNHPFIDGNKRAGYLAAHTFLELNGYSFRPVEADIVTMIVALAAGAVDEGGIAAWFSDFSTPSQEQV